MISFNRTNTDLFIFRHLSHKIFFKNYWNTKQNVCVIYKTRFYSFQRTISWSSPILCPDCIGIFPLGICYKRWSINIRLSMAIGYWYVKLVNWKQSIIFFGHLLSKNRVFGWGQCDKWVAKLTLNSFYYLVFALTLCDFFINKAGFFWH